MIERVIHALRTMYCYEALLITNADDMFVFVPYPMKDPAPLFWTVGEGE